MEIHYTTTNSAKVASLKRDLQPYNIRVIHVHLDIPEPRSNDVVEIAKEKVLFAYKHLNKPVVALDAGFYIHSINGFPKAFVNFTLETIGLEGILKLVENKDRSCEFRECLTFLEELLLEPKCFIGNVKGTLAYKQRGEMQKHLWSKLGLIFIPEGSSKTLAEMTHEEYLEWRKISREKESPSRKFAEWFTAYKK